MPFDTMDDTNGYYTRRIRMSRNRRNITTTTTMMMTLLFMSTAIMTVYGWTNIMNRKLLSLPTETVIDYSMKTTRIIRIESSKKMMKDYQHHALISNVKHTSSTRLCPMTTMMMMSSFSDNNEENDNDRLIMSNEQIEEHMKELQSKYPTNENAYLAASKARAIKKTPSRTDTATDNDWIQISKEKKRFTSEDDDDDNDWIRSIDDAASTNESRILFFPDEIGTSASDGDEDNEDNGNNEPKLLLF